MKRTIALSPSFCCPCLTIGLLSRITMTDLQSAMILSAAVLFSLRDAS